MKIDPGQRRIYLLALIVLASAIAVLCIWFLWMKDDGSAVNDGYVPQYSAQNAAQPAAPVYAVQTDAGQVNTVVYYQDNYGYLVPVMCRVPYEDGIARATLEKMVQSAQNDMQAARLGLRTVIPEGVEMELDIADGRARIDIKYDGELEFADAAAESNMITAVVQTLTEFDTVKSVEFLFNGRKKEKLPNGTDVSGKFTRSGINPEAESLPTSASAPAKAMTLYFPGESTSVIVPVTRMVYSEADIDTAVVEMTRGPMSDALSEAVPEGCGVISVEVENGVARIDFTREFMQIVNNIDGGRLALKALTVTCTQFDGVESVEIYVEGEKWDTGLGELTAPTFANSEDEIGYEYIQTQAEAIFESE